jgi:hypothetical protein
MVDAECPAFDRQQDRSEIHNRQVQVAFPAL